MSNSSEDILKEIERRFVVNRSIVYDDAFREHMRGILHKEYCKCVQPDREAGFPYCHRCHRDVSDEDIDKLE